MSASAVAEFLLRNEYLLTALEFYQELVESGKPLPPFLKQFFEKYELELQGDPSSAVASGSSSSSSSLVTSPSSGGGYGTQLLSGSHFMDTVLQQSQNKSIQLHIPQSPQASSSLSVGLNPPQHHTLHTDLEDEMRKKDEMISILNHENSVLKQDVQKLKSQVKELLLSSVATERRIAAGTPASSLVSGDMMPAGPIVRGRSLSQPHHNGAGIAVPGSTGGLTASSSLETNIGPAVTPTSLASADTEAVSGDSLSTKSNGTGILVPTLKRRNSRQQSEEEQELLQLHQLANESIKHQEMLILNRLIYDYLAEMDYKITSISFSDEVDMSEHLDDTVSGSFGSVALSLLYLYRFYNHASNRGKQSFKDVEALQKALTKLEAKQKLVVEYEDDLRKQDKIIATLQLENRSLKDHIEALSRSDETNQSTDASTSETEKTEETAAEQMKKTEEEYPATSSGLQREISILKSKLKRYESKESNFVALMGDTLPSIIPSVKSSGREKLLPVLVKLFAAHDDPDSRGRIARSIFQLHRRPSESERRAIIDSCILLSREVSPEQFETSLLQRLWEDITHKVPERRQLVADACGLLAEYTRPEMHVSVLLLKLQQLMDDATDMVRLSVVENLQRLTQTMGESVKSIYPDMQAMVLKLLTDQSTAVSQAATETLLPSLLQYATSQGLLFSNFVVSVLDRLDENVCTLFLDRDQPHVSSEAIVSLLDILRASLPFIHESILSSVPDIVLKRLTADMSAVDSQEDSDEADAMIKATFDRWIIREFGSCPNASIFTSVAQRMDERKEWEWSAAEWLVQTAVRILSIAVSVDNSHESVHQQLLLMVASLCEQFGKVFTGTLMRKIFLSAIDLPSQAPFVSQMNQHLSLTSKERSITVKSRLLTLFLLGVLTKTDSQHFDKYLSSVVVSVAHEEKGWTHDHIPLLENAVRDTCRQSYEDEVMSIVWELVLNPSAPVRTIVVRLFSVIMDAISSAAIAVRIFPAMITLSTDPDDDIRMHVVRAMGKLVIDIDETKEFDKVEQQFEAFFADKSEEIRLECLRQLKSVIPSVDAYFRDKYILRKLLQISHDNLASSSSSSSIETRQRVAMMLYEGYRALDGCTLSKSSLGQFVVPGLVNLEKDARASIPDPSVRTSIKRMIKEYRRLEKSLPSDANSQARR